METYKNRALPAAVNSRDSGSGPGSDTLALLAEMQEYTETNAAGFLSADYYQPRLEALQEAFKRLTVQGVTV